ncbi:23S rRNA (adenine2503-C2)-methyltransferase [Eubacterium aggregans]|uniref:Probable dual-specificity RNA methyltransferase RlmN n=1 Tax=Eubacterium aggregans TaxID=81409 RepID=A0A1H4CV60_9FIRM|nr:23S rRNA (adenine(2503)-C(2))-methyltransferase RlmN [Eubacterium aggregans]SEA64323.1 23S rRNA (adenine2503-C2)-methyltransferase [Eubacterium aggregans]
MEYLFGKTLAECQDVMQLLGEPKYRGKQLYEWLYEKKATDLSDCTNLPAALRERMAERYGIGHGIIVEEQHDPVDGTSKFLIRLRDGECVETVLMSYKHGYSLCVSSQVGCAMGCAFCASTLGGKVRNLGAGEILDQIYLVEKEKGVRISNVVLMGIGEPLDNYDELLTFIEIANKGWGIGQRKITVSTCGLVPKIEALAKEDLQINLAISLHSPFQDRRETLMPIAKRYSMDELLKVCNNYFTITGRRISFEYALIAGFNDRQADVDELVRLFGGQNCHINLIGLNSVSESVYKGSDNVNFFEGQLKKRGINCTMRRKMGGNIDAACGQLRRKTNN